MTDLYYFAISVCILLCLCVPFLMYLDGYWVIIKTEIISEDTYDVIKSSPIWGDIPSGRLTKIVTKITYKNGREKYKTHSYKH